MSRLNGALLESRCKLEAQRTKNSATGERGRGSLVDASAQPINVNGRRRKPTESLLRFHATLELLP
jgi:hypothetical protein